MQTVAMAIGIVRLVGGQTSTQIPTTDSTKIETNILPKNIFPSVVSSGQC